MTTGEDTDVVLALLPAEIYYATHLQPHEVEWLVTFGVPIDAVQTLPVATICELYGEVLDYGPNVEAVKSWMTTVIQQVEEDKFDTWQASDETFIAFSQSTNRLTADPIFRSDEQDKKSNRQALHRLKTNADNFADELAKHAAYGMSANTTIKAVNEREREVFFVVRYSMMSISGASIYPLDSEAERLRKTVEAETRRRAGMAAA